MAGLLKSTAVLSILAMAAGATYAQSVISAKAGLIHYVEGDVTLDGQAVEMKTSQFPEMKEKQVLKTGEGRAEVLLTPGVFLRLSENSSVKLLSDRLFDTKIEALTGSILLEHGEISKETNVTLLYKDRAITFVKSGLYRLDADTGNFRVYQGQANIDGKNETFAAKQSREVDLNAPVMLAQKFNSKVGDEFYRWASRRASYLAIANISAAKSIRDSGYRLTSGMWSWNPWFNMFTYVPYGYYYSPFGYGFWNPGQVMQFYRPRYYGGGGNYNGGGYGGGAGIPTRAGSYSGPSMGAGDFSGRASSPSSGAVSSPGPAASSGGGASAPSSGGGSRR